MAAVLAGFLAALFSLFAIYVPYYRGPGYRGCSCRCRPLPLESSHRPGGPPERERGTLKKRCETCERIYPLRISSRAGESVPSLTEESREDIMMEDSPETGAFSALCPECRKEAWEEEAWSLPPYPYRH